MARRFKATNRPMNAANITMRLIKLSKAQKMLRRGLLLGEDLFPHSIGERHCAILRRHHSASH